MRKLSIVAVMALAGLLFSTGSARAQVAGGTEVTANIPFQFYAGNTRFPAGSYKISQLDPTDPNVLTISTAKGQITTIMLVDTTQNSANASRATSTELSFNKYGTRFFLASIQVQGSTGATVIQKSPYETLVSKGEVQGEGRRVPGQRTTKKTS